jgi:hypothetical protein
MFSVNISCRINLVKNAWTLLSFNWLHSIIKPTSSSPLEKRRTLLLLTIWPTITVGGWRIWSSKYKINTDAHFMDSSNSYYFNFYSVHFVKFPYIIMQWGIKSEGFQKQQMDKWPSSFSGAPKLSNIQFSSPTVPRATTKETWNRYITAASKECHLISSRNPISQLA